MSYVETHRPGDRVTVTEDTLVDVVDGGEVGSILLRAGLTLIVMDARPGDVQVYGECRPVWIRSRMVRAAQ